MKSALIEYDIDLILNHPHQPRKNYSMESIKQLADSIHKNGLIQPIVLSSTHIPYRLVVGQRRLLSYRYLRDNIDKHKYKSIPAIIENKGDLKKDTLIALTENMHREDLNIIDKAESFKTLIDCGFARTHNEIADLLSISRRMVSKYIAIAELHEVVKTIIVENQYADSQVLSKLQTVENQKETIEEIIVNKLSRKDALRLVSGKGIMVTKTETNLKKKSKVFSGVWGKIEKTPKRVSLRIDPSKLSSAEKYIFEKLLAFLEESAQEDQ